MNKYEIGDLVTAPTISSFSAFGTGSYAVGSNLTVTFSSATDRSGVALNTVVSKSEVDKMFKFNPSSVRLGNNYQGMWIDDSNFVIQVLDITGASAPVVGQTTVTALASGLIRGKPFSELPTTSTSSVLTGSFTGTI